MKASPKSYGMALAALALAGLSSSAEAALDLGGYLGPLTLNIRSLDNSTIYSVNQANGLLSNGSNIATGAHGPGSLDTLAQQAAYNNGSAIPNAGADTWAIFQVTSIAGTSGDVYDSVTSGYKLWGLYEATDIAVQTFQPNPGDPFAQNVASSGLSISLYAIPNDVNVFNIAPGGPFTQIPSSNHTDLGVFTNITTLGTLELTLDGHAGVLGANTTVGPNPGGDLTEILANFDSTTNTGEGTAFLDVRTSGTLGDSNSLFDTNSFADGSDIQLQFNTSATVNWFTFQNPQNLNGTSNWLLGDSDPAQALIANVPEPGTALAVLGCLVPMCLGRRRKVASSRS